MLQITVCDKTWFRQKSFVFGTGTNSLAPIFFYAFKPCQQSESMITIAGELSFPVDLPSYILKNWLQLRSVSLICNIICWYKKKRTQNKYITDCAWQRSSAGFFCWWPIDCFPSIFFFTNLQVYLLAFLCKFGDQTNTYYVIVLIYRTKQNLPTSQYVLFNNLSNIEPPPRRFTTAR